MRVKVIALKFIQARGRRKCGWKDNQGYCKFTVRLALVKADTQRRLQGRSGILARMSAFAVRLGIHEPHRHNSTALITTWIPSERVWRVKWIGPDRSVMMIRYDKVQR